MRKSSTLNKSLLSYIKVISRQKFKQDFKTWEFVRYLMYDCDKLSKESMYPTLFVATAAAAQPYIAITHLHAKSELIHGTANDPHTAECGC